MGALRPQIVLRLMALGAGLRSHEIASVEELALALVAALEQRAPLRDVQVREARVRGVRHHGEPLSEDEAQRVVGGVAAGAGGLESLAGELGGLVRSASSVAVLALHALEMARPCFQVVAAIASKARGVAADALRVAVRAVFGQRVERVGVIRQGANWVGSIWNRANGNWQSMNFKKP